MDLEQGEPPEIDLDLEHPRASSRCSSATSPLHARDASSAICGVPRAAVRSPWPKRCVATPGPSARRRSVYAVGWTHHTTGVQIIRAASIIQLLLGNIGRPGGGILALRGHANIQGSTDIPTLYDILPSYIPMPHPASGGDLDEFVDKNGPSTGVWGELKAYTVSLLKAWWGERARPSNEYLLRRPAAHRRRPLASTRCSADDRRRLPGLTSCVGQNPAVGSANGSLARKALREPRLARRPRPAGDRDGFVLARQPGDRDRRGTRRGHRHRGVLPARRRAHREGRLVHEHAAAASVAREGGRAAGRLPLGPVVHPPARPAPAAQARGLAARARPAAAGAHVGLPDVRERRAERGRGAAEINGRHADGSFVARTRSSPTTARPPAARGCTPASTPTASTRPRAAGPRTEQNWIAPEWGWAWPANRRILYNRASADPHGAPWSERKRYVWWDAGEGKWTATATTRLHP